MTRYGHVAKTTSAAFVIISHLSRAKHQKTADGRVGGSLAIAQYARVRGVLGHLPADAKIAEPERRCAFVVKKVSHGGGIPPAIVYERVTDKRPTIAFLEARKDVFADAMIQVADDSVTGALTAVEQAKETIVRFLADSSIEAEALEARLIAQTKTSKATYRRAREELVRERVIVRTQRSGPNQPSRWMLSRPPAQDDARDADAVLN
jgi:hypothetical protein